MSREQEETTHQHWERYWKLLRARKSVPDEDEEESDTREKLRMLVLHETPRPLCCERGTRFLRATISYYAEPPEVPYWPGGFLPARPDPFDSSGTQWEPIEFCPFCGTRLPSFRKKETPPPYVCVTDGYYCETCGERGHACYCAPPVATWEISP